MSDFQLDAVDADDKDAVLNSIPMPIPIAIPTTKTNIHV
jgi:hypothetical protein